MVDQERLYPEILELTQIEDDYGRQWTSVVVRLDCSEGELLNLGACSLKNVSLRSEK